MVDHIWIKINGCIAEPLRSTTGNAITGNQQGLDVVPVVNNKSAQEVKYEMGNQIQATKELSVRAKEIFYENAEQRRRGGGDSKFGKIRRRYLLS